MTHPSSCKRLKSRQPDHYHYIPPSVMAQQHFFCLFFVPVKGDDSLVEEVAEGAADTPEGAPPAVLLPEDSSIEERGETLKVGYNV